MKDKVLRNNLRKVRRSNSDLTQVELSQLVGCTRQTIIALEKNKYNPSLILALKLSEVLNVPIEEIFYLEE